MKIKSKFVLLDVLNNKAIKAFVAAKEPTPVVITGTVDQNPISHHDGTSQEFMVNVASVKVMTQATQDVLAERHRQLDEEGWVLKHDDTHVEGELVGAAVCYAQRHSPRYVAFEDGRIPYDWPWHDDWWKPTDQRRDLVKAAALLLSEIERLDRAALIEKP